MKMRKMLALGLASAMAVSLAACGGSASSSEAPAASEAAPAASEAASTAEAATSEAAPAADASTGDKEKLTIALRGGTYAAVVEACLPAFEADNNCEIEFLELEGDDLHSKLALDSVNPEGAYDLAMVGSSWVAEFLENDMVANLTELGYSFDDDVIGATTRSLMKDGDAYFAPYFGNVTVMMYNKELVEAAGYKPGDFTMVIGYPGRTNRYSSAPEINFSGKVELPITNALRKGQMDVMRRWMDSDPAIRLKYSDTFFSLTNLGEMQEGEELCLRRFDVYSDKEADAAQLQAWIDADPARKDRWGNLIPRMREIYAAQENAEKARIIYRENLVRGAIIDRTFLRLTSARGDLEAQRKTLQQGFDETDLRVEKDLMRLAIERYCALMDPAIMGPYQKEMLAKYNGETGKMADWLWDNSFIAKGSLEAYTGKDQLHEDPLWKFLNDVTTTDLNNLEGGLEARQELTNLQREYKIAMYRMREDKGVPQYPDANSTMRISYGTVGALEPWDGMYTSWHTTSAGLLEKYNPARHEFKYDDRMHALVNEGDWGNWAALEKNGPRKRAAVTRKMYINFLTDNDITGGNSGSPVLNARGELIGLAFDGNKESLASDVYYTPGYNMCVNVDIRYVLWLIDHYGGLDYIIDELGL